jgi:hypothetical protein
VHVPPKRTVKFKVGRLMKQTLIDNPELDFSPTKQQTPTA